MDNVACARLQDRAKFIPARDEAGEETAGIYRTTVQFRFNDTRPEIPRDMKTRMSFIVEPDGTVSNCMFARITEVETEASNRCPAGRMYEPPLNEAGEPVRIRLEVESTVKRTELPD